jgi:hypothetical protein
VVEKVGGHASLKTTERYLHLADSDLDLLIQRPLIAKENDKVVSPTSKATVSVALLLHDLIQLLDVGAALEVKCP